MRSPLSIILRAALLVAFAALPAGAVTWNVGSGGSIQATINGASSGDIVQVAAGTFVENITLKKGVQLRGAGPELTTIDGGGLDVTVSVPTGCTSSTTVESFRITGGFGYKGGGLFLEPATDPLINNCLIEGNESQNYGGGIYVGEGGSPTIQFCTIRDNTAHEGGGIYVQGHWSGGAPTIQFNVICNNTGLVSSGGIHIALCQYDVQIRNNSIANNTAAGWGSGISIVNSVATVMNNIIAFNDGAAGFLAQGSTVHGGCNVVYGNTGVDFSGVTPGEGTIVADPQFCDDATCDLTVGSTSPALAQESCGLIGALPVGCNFTATQPTSWGGVKSIFR